MKTTDLGIFKFTGWNCTTDFNSISTVLDMDCQSVNNEKSVKVMTCFCPDWKMKEYIRNIKHDLGRIYSLNFLY
jgi:hypothetical protein